MKNSVLSFGGLLKTHKIPQPDEQRNNVLKKIHLWTDLFYGFLFITFKNNPKIFAIHLDYILSLSPTTTRFSLTPNTLTSYSFSLSKKQ